jgi:three-Cys-motif partner protein
VELKLNLDKIGPWSEVKLSIIKEYAQIYSTILNAQKVPFHYSYIDGFAGAGFHVSRTSGELIHGSPTNALLVEPPFKEYHFIDTDPAKVNLLQQMAKGHSNVYVHQSDCNVVLPKNIFPKIKYEDYRRALCVLDPYGLHLDWIVLEAAAELKTIDIFLNFPIYDININVLRRNKDSVEELHKKRFSKFWGDNSWEEIVYRKVPTLFGEEEEKIKNEELALLFRKRLQEVAGFAHVPAPIDMRNSSNSTVYYLYFASQKDVASKIVKNITKQYKSARIQ